MYCSDCENLNDSKKKDGSIRGCMYECKKLKKMVPGNFTCDKFSKSYSRKEFDKRRIYTEGRIYSDKVSGNPGWLLFFIILLVLLALIMGVFKF